MQQQTVLKDHSAPVNDVKFNDHRAVRYIPYYNKLMAKYYDLHDSVVVKMGASRFGI